MPWTMAGLRYAEISLAPGDMTQLIKLCGQPVDELFHIPHEGRDHLWEESCQLPGILYHIEMTTMHMIIEL